MGMRLCSLCAGELIAGSHQCPRCGAPVSPAEAAESRSADGGGTAEGWAPTPRTERSAAGVAPGMPFVPVQAPRPAIRRDWPGAVRAAALAMLGGYVLAAGLGTLLAPTGGSGPVLWITVPAALLAVALGGRWEADIVEVGDPGGTFGYHVHAFPLLITGLLVAVLARAMHARFETGRANDTLRDRLLQAGRLGVAFCAFGLTAALLSRVDGTRGLITHSGYISPAVGGLLIGLAVGVFTAVGYDLSQLPPGARQLWLELREPLRAARFVLLVVTVVGTLGVLIALQTSSPDQLVLSDEDRRMLSGLAIATAPNLGWWFLVACLGAPVRVDVLSGELGDGFGALFGHPAWWVPSAALASVLLAAIAVRLVTGAATPAQARRRLVSWTVLAAVAAPAVALAGTIRVAGGVGLLPVEYLIGSTSPLAVVLPPLWVALASAAGYAASRALRSSPRPEPSSG
jgi:hypothetical protein